MVWFKPSRSFTPPDFPTIDQARPYSAMVAYVWSDNPVNLTVSDHDGKTFGMTGVQLVQADEPAAGEWLFL